MSTCNICGASDFEPGPGGRLSPTGSAPRCVACRSLERHRSLRHLMGLVPPPMLSWRRALHLAPDNSLDAVWFRTYEPSQYGGENSIDVQSIERPDGAYDFISLSMVLEFVPDDRLAFGELLRVGSSSCILHCTFGSSFEDATSTHYDEPHGDYGRLHGYGLDFEEWFETERRGVTTLMVGASDPVTRLAERFHFFCRHRGEAETLRACFDADVPGSVEVFHPVG